MVRQNRFSRFFGDLLICFPTSFSVLTFYELYDRHGLVQLCGIALRPRLRRVLSPFASSNPVVLTTACCHSSNGCPTWVGAAGAASLCDHVCDVSHLRPAERDSVEP